MKSKTTDTSARGKSEQRPSGILIDPNAFFRRTDIVETFGVRFMNQLTKAGLRAVAGWYSGKAIHDTYERAWKSKSPRRGSEEGQLGEKQSKGKTGMGGETGSPKQGISTLPRKRMRESMASQIKRAKKLQAEADGSPSRSARGRSRKKVEKDRD